MDHPAARALAILLPQCDGAIRRDDCGLNKMDAAAYFQYGVDDLDRWAARLVKYRRQIGEDLAEECRQVAKAYKERDAKGQYLIRPHASGRYVVDVTFKKKDDAVTKAEIACGRRVLCWNHNDCPACWSVSKWVIRQLLASGHFVARADVDVAALPDPESKAVPTSPTIPAKTSKDFICKPDHAPFPYQVTGIDEMLGAFTSHQACINADEMGLGKSLQALGSAFALGDKLFVICPAGARMVWAAEVFKATTDKIIYVYKSGLTDKKASQLFGADSVRITDNSGEADVIIVSYAGCRNLVMPNPDPATAKFHTMKKVPKPALAKWLKKAIVVADEVQLMKNHKAARSQAAYAIIRDAKIKVAMSGTPITNRPDDFWGCLCACGLNRQVAKTRAEFFDRYVYGSERDNLHAKLVAAPWFIRRLKKDVMKDLPDKRWCDLIVEFDPKLEKEYAASIALLKSGNPTVMLKALTDLQTIANEAKVKPLTEHLLERVYAEQITVVQSTRTEPLFAIQAALKQENVRAETLTGADNDHSRALKIKQFQEGDYDIILTTLDSAITLTRSDTVILLDADWTPAKINQRVDRCHRIGQKNAVTIYKCISASIDRHKYDVVCKKAEVISEILDGGRNTWDEDTAMQEVILRLTKEAV